MSAYPAPPDWVCRRLRRGLVIPAHPLALTGARRLDVRRQRALTRYYLAAGAGGLAVGVHTTQFAIRQPQVGLLEPVLELAAATAHAESQEDPERRPVLVAGICGPTRQAVREAVVAREFGYHAGLLSLAALPDAGLAALLDHCRAVAREIPLFGFYLQPAVGGRELALPFWRRFAEIPNVVAIKIAPFNRYQTHVVIRGVAESDRATGIALYTGNDDHILLDLLTPFTVPTSAGPRRMRIVGGLLGQWACWTRAAVDMLERCHRAVDTGQVPADLLALAGELTDANAALFDAANGFRGCLPGIHEVLRRQGLLRGTWCLDPAERLSPGQRREILRVHQAYPHLADDAFVARHLAHWLRD